MALELGIASLQRNMQNRQAKLHYRTMLDWDDLRLFLAVARGGTLAAAARTLGVNPSTVFRRLKGLERAAGVRLVDRRPEGYVVTAAGQDMLARAARIEEEVLALDRRLAGRDLRLEGTVRVTAPDTVAAGLLPGPLAAFRQAHPGIAVELAVSNEMFSLSRREADVAVRPTRAPEGAMVGRRLAHVAFAVYGSRAYLAKHDAPARPEELRSHALIGPDDSLAGIGAARWLARAAGGAAPAFRANSILAQYHAVRAGAGLGVLPCFLADPDTALARVLPPEPDMGSELWLLTHADLRRTARVRAFLDFMAAALVAERDLIEGRRA